MKILAHITLFIETKLLLLGQNAILVQDALTLQETRHRWDLKSIKNVEVSSTDQDVRGEGLYLIEGENCDDDQLRRGVKLHQSLLQGVFN